LSEEIPAPSSLPKEKKTLSKEIPCCLVCKFTN